MDFDTLPAGERFAYWDDATVYRRAYHVAQQHPAAADDNPGTAEAPLRTINAAARLVQPGEQVIVHAGVYRECVRPGEGGSGPEAMIAYTAAPGETVVITGAEPWQPACVPSAGYSAKPPANGATIWMAELPEVFTEGYNPFLLRNAYEYLPVYGEVSNPEFLKRALLRRGAVYVDGQPLTQVYYLQALAQQDGAFWVEEPGVRVHFRLPGDADPAAQAFEITAREQLFAPRQFGLGYLRVSGFTFLHAADGFPVPQRAAVSTMRGHHWIIEGNTIAWANACGMDIGTQTWEATVPAVTGGHIVRGNTLTHCGVCGIAGALGVHHTLVEDNTIAYIGERDIERMWECAGLKFHLAEHSLIRRNTFRHLTHAAGIWLDCSNINNRITGNTIADVQTLTAGIFMEMNYDRNLVDHNILWDIRGLGVHGDCNDNLVVAHNFFGQVTGQAVWFSLGQHDRRHEGRTGICRGNVANNNVFYRCPHRIALGRREDNVCDGNLYDVTDDECAFEINYPVPPSLQRLAGWQRFYGLDQHSTQARLEATFDLDTGTLHWLADGPLPETQPVPTLPADAHTGPPGPCQQAEVSTMSRPAGGC